MANSHVMPSMMAETQSICGDLLAPVILASTLTTPGSGMTLPAFQTYGYVRVGSPTRLAYVNQSAAPVTIAGGAGAYWLALMHDTHSAVAGWTRQPGTHYCWQAAATQPADPAGGLVMAGVTVTGANITAVDTAVNWPYQKVAFGAGSGGLAFDKNLTWDGGSLNVTGRVLANNRSGDSVIGVQAQIAAAGGTNRFAFYAGSDAPSFLGGTLQVNGALGLGGAPVAGYALTTYLSTQLAANLTVNMVGTAATRTLDVNGTARVRQTFYVDGATDLVGAVIVYGGLHVSPYAGLGGAPDARFTLRSYGASYFDGTVNLGNEAGHKLNVGGNAYISGVLGVGRNPGGGWTIETNSILANAGIQGQTTLTIYGHTHLNTTLQVQGAATVVGQCAAGSFYTAGGLTAQVTSLLSLTVAGHTISNTLGTTGALTCGGTFGTEYIQTNHEVGIMRSPVAGWALSTGVGIQTSGTVGNKVGAGPWGEASSRHLKRAIADIPDALSLLLRQRGRRYEYDDEREHSLPGPQHGFVYDEVTIPQWRDVGPDGEEILTLRGSEALFLEALRTIVERVEALEEER